jgi:hypothetical protein
LGLSCLRLFDKDQAMQKKRAGELPSRDAAPAVNGLQALKGRAASFSPRRLSGRDTGPLRGTLREDRGMAYVGVVWAGRRGLRWHRGWALREQGVGWNEVRSCTVGTDRRPGVPRHTHRLVLEHDQGLLEVILRGPQGALALVGLRDRIRAAAHLQNGGENSQG